MRTLSIMVALALGACAPRVIHPIPAADAGPGPAPVDPSLKIGGVAGALYPGPRLGPRVGAVDGGGAEIYP